MNPIRILELGRGPTLEGTRFTVYDIVPLLQNGHNVAYIAAVFGMSQEQVEALVQYIEEHKEQVMAMNARIEERMARPYSPEVEAKVRASRGLARAKREELLRKRQQEANGARHPE